VLVSEQTIWQNERYQALDERAYAQVESDLAAAGLEAFEIGECCYEIGGSLSLDAVTAALAELPTWNEDTAMAEAFGG
jgi:hypothetical protein